MGGVFQIDREIFNHAIWEDVVKFRIFFYILGQAVFAEEGVTVAGIKLERGQYLRSLRKLQEDLAFKEGRGNAVKTYPLTTIQNKIKSLVKEGQIKVKSTERGTLFTVVNYALYQGSERFENGKSNSDRTAIEQLSNNNKNVNKDNNKDMSNQHADLFLSWWNLYDKKTGKAKCETKFAKLVKKYGYEQIEKGTKNYLQYMQRNNVAKQYQKNPLTFLNGEHFNDEYETGSQAATTTNATVYKSFEFDINRGED